LPLDEIKAIKEKLDKYLPDLDYSYFEQVMDMFSYANSDRI